MVAQPPLQPFLRTHNGSYVRVEGTLLADGESRNLTMHVTGSSIDTGIGIGGKDREAPLLLKVRCVAYWRDDTITAVGVRRVHPNLGVSIREGPRTSSTWSDSLRLMGVASAPGLLRAFVFVPIVGPRIALCGSAWRLVATIVVMRRDT